VLDTDTAAISGKPGASGRFRFTVVVTDSLEATAAMTYSLKVKRR
jgi:hypothetical protein